MLIRNFWIPIASANLRAFAELSWVIMTFSQLYVRLVTQIYNLLARAYISKESMTWLNPEEDVRFMSYDIKILCFKYNFSKYKNPNRIAWLGTFYKKTYQIKTTFSYRRSKGLRSVLSRKTSAKMTILCLGKLKTFSNRRCSW